MDSPAPTARGLDRPSGAVAILSASEVCLWFRMLLNLAKVAQRLRRRNILS
jgi:hypothetical protein